MAGPRQNVGNCNTTCTGNGCHMACTGATICSLEQRRPALAEDDQPTRK